ncbi:MAG: EAL domain-containing protein [Pseudomonadota bacterium]
MATLHLRGALQDTGAQLGERVLVGSDPGCHLIVADASASSVHCELLRQRDGQYQLTHLATGAVTLLNGAPAECAPLKDGDVLTVGRTELLFAQAQGEVLSDRDIDFDDVSARISVRQDAARPAFDSAHGAGDGTEGDLAKLKAAYGLARTMGLHPSLDGTLQRVLDTVFEVFHADRGAIFLLEPGSEKIAEQRARTRMVEGERVKVSRSVLRKALDSREAILSLDAASDARFSTSHSVRLSEVRSIMCAPMIFQDEIVGLIYLDSMMSSGLFSERDLDVLTTFAQQAAMAVKNAHLLSELKKANRDLRGAKDAAESANDALRHKNDELEKLVVRDPLTSLYNHAYLQEQAELEIRRSRRHNLSFGLLLLNIDGFRAINDAHGHTAGNSVLCLLADLLRGAGRGTDMGARISERGTVTRYDGDTFAVLLPETHKRGASVAAERVRTAVNAHDFAAAGLPRVSVSIGVAGFPEDGTARAGLIHAAETALFTAKHLGGDQTIAYSPSLQAMAEPRSSSELGRIVALDRLIRERLMRYVYQPIVDARAMRILGYEALCRPDDGVFGNPLELLEVAERRGRIGDLGPVMRALAMVPLDRLPAPRLLFVNLHPLELSDELVTWAHTCPQRERIVLEITESAEIKEYDRVRDLIQRLRHLGFYIALDDLGAGYSGLNSLALLEPDFVKIDMRLVRDIDSNSRSARLIKHIIDYARGEGMRVVAEGIETVHERDVVLALGCDLIQGYLFARPAPPFCELEVAT